MQQPTKNDMEKPELHETRSEEAHGGHSAMMWMMAIFCGLPVLLLLVVPALTGGLPSNLMWWAIAGVAVLALCALMMRHHRGGKGS